MSWSPIELYYAHSLAGLVATSEVSGYPVSNLLNRIDGNLWKATSNADQIITFDAGVGNTYTADYLLIFCHNLKTAGAYITFQISSNNFSSTIYSTTFAAPNDHAILLKFGSYAARYWRVWISNCSVPPWMAMCQWGPMTVLDYADSMTPYNLERKGNVNVGDAGYLQGIHEKYQEWGLQIKFMDADTTMLAKVQAWEAAVGLGLCGISWDPGDHSTDVRVLRRKDGKFTAPIKVGGLYTDLTLDLIGRKE